MEKKTTEPTSESRATWDGLEALMRQMIQSWLQDLLEEEVSELPGGRAACFLASVAASRRLHFAPADVSLVAAPGAPLRLRHAGPGRAA